MLDETPNKLQRAVHQLNTSLTMGRIVMGRPCSGDIHVRVGGVTFTYHGGALALRRCFLPKIHFGFCKGLDDSYVGPVPDRSGAQLASCLSVATSGRLLCSVAQRRIALHATERLTKGRKIRRKTKQEARDDDGDGEDGDGCD